MIISFYYIFLFSIIITLLVYLSIILIARYNERCEPFENLNTDNIAKKDYTSYSDLILQETIANRDQYIKELLARDVTESNPWITRDGVWEQGSLYPSGRVNAMVGAEPWKRQSQWVPYDRKYSDFMDVLYIGNPLPQ